MPIKKELGSLRQSRGEKALGCYLESNYSGENIVRRILTFYVMGGALAVMLALFTNGASAVRSMGPTLRRRKCRISDMS
jgi:hypothetical protein